MAVSLAVNRGLGIPGRHLSKHAARREAADRGESHFAQIGCQECHIPEMTLSSAVFTEPNPFNPPGNLQVGDVSTPFAFDMTSEGVGPRLESHPDGGAIVRAFTDRHRGSQSVLWPIA